MIVDIANNPRIVQVLGRIEELRRAAAERPDADAERARLEGEIATMYVEVGHYTHWLMRQDPGSLAQVEAEARRYAESLGRMALPPTPRGGAQATGADSDTDEWADTETLGAVELHALDTGAMAAIRSEGADDWDLSPYSDLPEVDPIGPLDLEDPDLDQTAATGATPATVSETGSYSSDAASPWDEGNLDLLEFGDHVEPEPVEPPKPPPAMRARVRTAEPTPVITEPTLPQQEAPLDWTRPLRELLDVVGPPERADDPTEQAECVSALGRVTTNLEIRWTLFPDSVQQALLGYVGARARRLAENVPTDADIRLAIGRMERFSLARGLMTVPSLRRSGPSRDWRADERRLWAVLQAGL